MRIRRQPAHTPGLVGHALDTDLIEKTFWTVSAWTSNAELNPETAVRAVAAILFRAP